MNVRPGFYFGFLESSTSTALQRAMRPETPEEYMLRVGTGVQNCTAPRLGMQNAFVDPYRVTYFEERYGIHRVWEDVT